ncbi:hypothetical protein, partial [Planktothrix paucivesiculata]|uniref:hypothetical protein n=1 Tax=Planktothrix paucivesiculata TaxID=1678308 RepID=UPI001E4F7647
LGRPTFESSAQSKNTAPSKVIPGRYEKNEKHNNSFQTPKSGSKPRTIQHLASVNKKEARMLD